MVSNTLEKAMARRSRTGNAAIQTAVMFTTMLMFAALAVDLGALRMHEVTAHNAAEAGAHAGVRQLDGTSTGMSDARTMTVNVAYDNSVEGQPVTLDANTANDSSGDIVLGKLDSSGHFVADSSNPSTTTSIKVTVGKDDLPVFFGGIFGADALSVSENAIAVGGGPMGSDCPFPIGVPSCALTPQNVCGFHAQMSDSNADTSAWALPGTARPSSSTITAAWDRSACAAASSTSDVASLNNGAVASDMHYLKNLMINSGGEWDTAAWGAIPAQDSASDLASNYYGHKTLTGEIIVFQDPDNCVNSSMNGTALPIVGYATAVIYDVKENGSPKWAKLQIICTETREPAGGGFYGTIAAPRFITE
jgi:Flp pilus assembly protein TadG